MKISNISDRSFRNFSVTLNNFFLGYSRFEKVVHKASDYKQKYIFIRDIKIYLRLNVKDFVTRRIMLNKISRIHEHLKNIEMKDARQKMVGITKFLLIISIADVLNW